MIVQAVVEPMDRFAALDLTPRWQCPAGDINGSVLSWHLDQAAVSVYLNLVSESFPPTTALPRVPRGHGANGFS